MTRLLYRRTCGSLSQRDDSVLVSADGHSDGVQADLAGRVLRCGGPGKIPVRRIILAATLLGMAAGPGAGCVSRSYTPASDQETRELRIKAGDEIRVVTLARERIALEVSEVLADRFVGVTLEPRAKEPRPEGERVEVRYDELALLEVTRVSKGAVAAGALAAVVTVGAYALVVGGVGVLAAPPAL
jgi:hypothetical protein